MSLSSQIRNPTPVRDRLIADFPKPRLLCRPKLVAPRICERPATVGTAYDYLLRFYLMREMPFAVSYTWTAERALSKMTEFGECPFVVGRDFVPADVLSSIMELTVQRTKRALTRWVAGEALSTRLAALSLYLADCDDFDRTGRMGERSFRPTSDELADLRRIIDSTDLKLFRAARICLLNPEFGEGTRLIEGADSDLLLDDVLIDVKTTNDFHVRPRDWYQLIGYIALNRHFPIGGGSTPIEINRFPRRAPQNPPPVGGSNSPT